MCFLSSKEKKTIIIIINAGSFSAFPKVSGDQERQQEVEREFSPQGALGGLGVRGLRAMKLLPKERICGEEGKVCL